MSKKKIPRISERDLTLIWLSAFMGAITSKLFDEIFAQYEVPAHIPQQYQVIVASIGSIILFFFTSLLIVYALFHVISKLGIIRTE